MIDRRIAIVCAAFLCAAGLVRQVKAEELPQTVPVPEVHAAPAGNIPPKHLGDTPVPEARPEAAGTDGSVAEPGKAVVDMPAVAPIPPAAPDEPANAPTATQRPASAPQPDQRSAAPITLLMPREEIVCRQKLRKLGATFKDLPRESSDDGCSLPYPLELSGLGQGADVEPAATLNCATAEALARFAREDVAPAAEKALSRKLTGIAQASGYACRPRNGTTKLSEHAFGNAIDIAAFRLADGQTIPVEDTSESKAKAFLDQVRTAACGRFTTVLGPGSNADHATHLHLDLAPRRHGTVICE